MSRFKEVLGKFWNVVKESKLNMSMFVAGVISFVLVITIICIMAFRGSGIDNTIKVEKESETKDTAGNETTEDKKNDDEEAVFSTEINENSTNNIVEEAEVLKGKLTITDSWEDDGEYFVSYNLDMTNVSGKDISGWAALLSLESSATIIDQWNFRFEETKNDKIKVYPIGNKKNISDEKYVSGGFILKGDEYVFIDYITVFVGDSVETIKNTSKTLIPKETKPKETTDEETTDETTDETVTDETMEETTEEDVTEEITEEETTEEEITEEETTPEETTPEEITPESTTPEETTEETIQ